MKLNWFTPLPPARTDITRYTTVLLPALGAHAEVSLWTDQVQWDKQLKAHARVVHFAAEKISWPELHGADLNIYNIGNNHTFHSGIWQISQQAPGIVILHDLCLQHLFGGHYLQARKDRSTYIWQMARYYGEAGRRTAQSFAAGACSTESLAIRYPLTGLALEGALGVVVHTRMAFETVTRMSHRPVLYAPLPYQASSLQTRGQWDESRRQSARPPYKIVVIGYLGPNRRLDSILRAISELPDRGQFRLCIYGPVWDPDNIRRLIRTYGLHSLVEVHGYVEDLDREIADAALALNLRNPTMGEASGSQLRLWDHAIPTMVTQTGWYESLPPDAIIFVRPEAEVEDIRAGLQSFLRDPAGMSRLGEKGRQVLDTEHSPEQYAASLAAFAPLARRAYSRTAALSLADRAGADLKRWAPPHTSGAWLDHFAEVIASLVPSGRVAGAE